MRIEVTGELTPAQCQLWGQFLQTAQGSHPEQDPRFAAVHRAEGKQVLFAMGYDEGGNLGAVAMFALTPHPFLPGAYSDAMAYSGPVCDDPAMLLAFLRGVMDDPILRRLGRLRITPYWLGQGGVDLGSILQSRGWQVFEADPVRETGLVDLRPEEETILARFVKSARYETRKAAKQGLVIEPVTTEDQARRFFDSLQRHRLERGMGGLSQAAFLAAFENVYRERQLGALTLVTQGGDVVGGWQCHCGVRNAHLIAVITEPAKLKELNNLRVSPFLCLDAMRWAKAQGAFWLDVEGFKPDMQPNHPLFRVYRYKAEFMPDHVLRVAGHGLVRRPFLHLTGNTSEILRRTARRWRARLKGWV